jgi:hypothetical protein
LGLYDIHYDSSSLNLNGGSSEDLKTILEEVSHAKQFLDEWAGMKQRTIIQPSVDYYHAMDAWENKYARAVLKGGGYSNELEKWAKNNANKILQQLVSDPQLQQQGNLCGFDLKRYTIQIIH